MKPEKYCANTQTIIYHIQTQSPQLSQWINESKPFVTDVSEKEAIVDFKDHIAKREGSGAPLEEINSKKQELIYLERFFSEAITDGRYIRTALDVQIQTRAHEINNNRITPSVQLNDCTIAAACEQHGLILVTSDIDLKNKLTKENELNKGRFQLQTYEYAKDGRHETTFRRWNDAAMTLGEV